VKLYIKVSLVAVLCTACFTVWTDGQTGTTKQFLGRLSGHMYVVRHSLVACCVIND